MRVKPHQQFESEVTLGDDLALIVKSDEALDGIKSGLYNRVGWYIIGQLPMDDETVPLERLVTIAEDETLKFEQSVKDRHGITSMPAAYRSAKSVIIKAINHGVDLTDDQGELKGKSELEKECKTREASTSTLDAWAMLPDKVNKPIFTKGNQLFEDLYNFLESECERDFAPELMEIWADWAHKFKDE